jgi:hypothetical protein
MRLVDLMMRGVSYLNIGAFIAVVLWVMWVVSLSAASAWADLPLVQTLHACPCMNALKPPGGARRT